MKITGTKYLPKLCTRILNKIYFPDSDPIDFGILNAKFLCSFNHTDATTYILSMPFPYPLPMRILEVFSKFTREGDARISFCSIIFP